MSTFGKLLRQYRNQCTDPLSGKHLTQEQLAELLGQEPNVGSYTGATISHWERGKYRIDHDDRGLLVGLTKVLHKCGGIKTLDEANMLLLAGNYRPLDEYEIRHISSTWAERKPEATPNPPRFQTNTPAPPFMTPPLPPQGILGRDNTLKRIIALLALEDANAADVPLLALRGMGGVGKTTLAIAVGRWKSITKYFPGGVLWVALGAKPTIRTLLDRWGWALGVDLQPLPDETACRERLRAVLFRRRVLLLVDDVWNVRHGQAFAVGGPHSRMLLTTREAPIAYNLATKARTIRVDILSLEASLELLRRLAPAVMIDAENAQRLCERLDYLPLALTLAGK